MLLIVRAGDADQIERRLADDPWTDGMLETTRTAPWTLRLGSVDRRPGLRVRRFGRFLGLVERDGVGQLTAARAALDRLLLLFGSAEVELSVRRLAGST